jgi:hypothetical protein
MSSMPMTGPGAFVAFPSMMGGYDAIIDRAADLGLKWLAPRGADRGRDQNWTTPKAVHAVAKAKSLGIAMYPWVYSRPDAVTSEIECIRQFILEGAAGAIIDGEDPWVSGTNHVLEGQKKQLAVRYMGSLRQILPDVFVAHCPYAYPAFHTDFPYVEFGQGCDMVMPQLYWTEFNDAGFQKHFDVAKKQWANFNAKNPNANKPVAYIGNTYGHELKGVLNPPPGEMHVSDFDAYVRAMQSIQNCTPLYSLEASKKEVLEEMMRLWGHPSDVPPPIIFEIGDVAGRKVVQGELAAEGFDVGNADGVFGSRTTAAICAFQAKHGLDVDGTIGPKTLAALMLAYNDRTKSAYNLSLKWGASAMDEREAEMAMWDRRPFGLRDFCTQETQVGVE